MKRLYSVITISVILFAITNLNAQSKWSFEFRPGGSVTTQNLGNTELSTGLGFDLAFAYKLMPHLSAYGGWGWNQFSADNSFAGNNVHFEETGYTFGFQFIHPIANSKVNYLVRFGGLYNHIETENKDGDIINDTGHGLGWQAEAGFAIPISEKVKLLPGIRYHSLSREIKMNGNKIDADLKYLSGGIGLQWAF